MDQNSPSSSSAAIAAVPKPWLDHYPQGLAWARPLKTCAVYEFLYETAETYGDRPAFDFLGKKWTWREITDLVDRCAVGLQHQGVGRGVKVGLFLPNCPYFLIVYYAILRAGGTVVNFNPMYAMGELRHQVEDSETDMMVTLDLKILYDKVQTLKETRLKKVIVCRFTDILPFPKNILFPLVKGRERAKVTDQPGQVWFHDLIVHGTDPTPVAIDLYNDIAVLQYTGGTTGIAKGAMLTHANVTANTEQAVSWFQGLQAGQERMMGILPFFHVFAMTVVMNMSVRCGFEIIAVPRFDIKQVFGTIRRTKPTCFPAVPAIYNAMSHHKLIRRADLSCLRVCIAGGAPMPAEVRTAFEKYVNGPVMEGYGLTEASPVLTMNPIISGNRPGTIGQPLPGTTIVILDLDTGQPAVLGSPGEVCAYGPQVMKGYYNHPAETAKVLVDGLLHTGDVAIMDADGFVTIVDRIKDMIIINGYKIYPRNVEEVIYKHPAVEECIVAGIADPAKGEVAKAWVKPKEGQSLTAEELKTFLKSQLSPLEMPRQIEIRQTPLPKTAIGKLSRKDILAEEKARSGAVAAG